MKLHIKLIMFVVMFVHVTILIAQENVVKVDSIRTNSDKSSIQSDSNVIIPVGISSADSIKPLILDSNIVKYNKWSIYGYLGFSQFYGDVVNSNSFSPISARKGTIATNVFFGGSYQLTKLFSVDGRMEYSNFVSERTYSKIFFKGNLFHYSVATSFSYLNLIFPKVEKRKWNSYLLLGLGVSFYRSALYSTTDNSVMRFVGYTNEVNGLERDSRKVVPSITFGIGAKYRLNKQFDIAFEFSETKIFNDQLDALIGLSVRNDVFGHTSFGLVYHIEKNEKTLVWDFPTQMEQIAPRLDSVLVVDTALKVQLLDTSVVKPIDTTAVAIVKTESISVIDMSKVLLIKGAVFDENKIPIEAYVEMVEKIKNVVIASSQTDSTGKFSIMVPAGIEYSLVTKAKGFAFHTENVVISDTTIASKIEKEILMIKLEAGKKIVLRNIFYDFNKSTLRPESNVELLNLLEMLNSNPQLKIEISGHTDNVGKEKYNKKHSEARAKKVVSFLIKKGIAKERLVYVGYGLDQPIAPNETDEGRQLNRRTEFKIINN
jgi:outer membrane protein OmpA-like peptidoglycan-associated protein